jgi:predicted dehydrogenase
MKTPQQIQLGVIGLGNIAQQHIQHISQQLVPHCRVSALCSRQPSSLAATLEIDHFTSYQALIDSGLCNAVLIATPTYSHAEIGAYALQAGLHVLMEKPIGLSILEGEQLLALQGKTQVFALMLNQRTDPLFKHMHELIHAGHLGEIRRCHWTMTNWFRPEVYFQVSDWRATWRGEGGGLLVNQCIHNLDILQWLCGMPNKITAFCQFGKYHDIEVEDEATAYFEYANGASGVFIGSTGEAPGINQLDIIGDRGSLNFNGKQLTLTENTPATSEFNRTTRDMFGLPQSYTQDITPDRAINQHVAILTNFANAIISGEKLIAPAAHGLPSLALANGMLLSSWQERAVELPLDSQVYQNELQKHLARSALREKANIEATIDMSKSYR